MTYQPKIYRQQGGATLVITSSGTLNMDGTVNCSGTIGTSGSGKVSINTGGTLNVASGSSFTCGTDLEIASGGAVKVASGGTLAVAAGGAFTVPYQAAATTATVITAYGITNVTGTTAGPSFQIAAPVAGCVKFVSLTATSSGVTHRATLIAPTTTVSFTGIAGDEGNTLTLATSAIHAATLVGVSATAWRIVGVYTSTMGGISATS